jgi:hypothetical protein
MKDRNYMDKVRTGSLTSYENVSEKINNITSQINSLLSSKLPIRTLIPDTPDKTFLSPSIKCHYEIEVRKQLMPLKVNVITNSKTVNLILYFSHKIKRPNKDNNEKAMIVKTQIAYLSYKTDNSKYFVERYLYITIESDKECNVIVTGSFRKSNFIGKSVEDKSLVLNDDLMSTDKAEDKEFEVLISPRRSRVLRIRPCTKKTKRKMMELRKHRMEVVDSGKKKDNEELCRKFLSYHKAELKDLLIATTQKELKKQNRIRRLLGYWVQMVKVIKVGLLTYKKFIGYKKKRAADTLRLYKAMKIYMFIKGKLSIDSLGFKDRLWQKITL